MGKIQYRQLYDCFPQEKPLQTFELAIYDFVRTTGVCFLFVQLSLGRRQIRSGAVPANSLSWIFHEILNEVDCSCGLHRIISRGLFRMSLVGIERSQLFWWSTHVVL